MGFPLFCNYLEDTPSFHLITLKPENPLLPTQPMESTLNANKLQAHRFCESVSRLRRSLVSLSILKGRRVAK